MKNPFILSFILVFSFSVVSSAMAQTADTIDATETAIQVVEITAQDLEVENPGMLPTSPFYFLKNLGRTIKRTATFNPIKRANLELEIANQQAAEIAELKEIAPERADAIAKASQNYQDNVTKLQKRLEALKDTSQNPNVDKLMDKLADRSIKHQQLFNELKQKFSDNPELKQNMEAMQNKMQDALIKIPEKFDNPEMFKERMQKAIDSQTDSAFKEMRGIEMIENIEKRLPENQRATMQDIRENLMGKFGERINAMPESEQRTFMMPHMLEIMPGNPALKTRIFDEMQGRIQLSPDIKEQMDSSQKQILESAVIKGEISQTQADEQIKRAEKAIEELNAAVNASNASSVDIDKMKNALTQAKNHLNKAKESFAAGKYGEAFGQAVSAFSMAKNGLRIPFHLPMPMSEPGSGGIMPQPSLLPPKIFSTSSNGTVCIQVITPAVSLDGICKNFPTPCDVPMGWKRVNSCNNILEIDSFLNY